MSTQMPRLLEEMANANARLGQSDVASSLKAFRQFSANAHADGALSRKHKELIAVSIALSKRCERCIAYHARAALNHGASEEELLEAAFVTIIMDGGPALAHVSLIYDCIDEYGDQQTRRVPTDREGR